MIREDYLMQQIRLLVDFLALLLGLKKKEDYNAIDQAINEYAKKEGINLSMLSMISIESLDTIFNNSDTVKTYITAVLIKEQAYNIEKKSPGRFISKDLNKALHLLLMIENDNLNKKIQGELIDILLSEKLIIIPRSLLEKLVNFCLEKKLLYQLYNFLDQIRNQEQIEIIEETYKRLLKLNDEELNLHKLTKKMIWKRLE